ncbi:MAG: DUF721 domain-containing protein [Actinomycetales bacterium]|nr:DUF721 domain-containing protein [Actinomycetales bacterium]
MTTPSRAAMRALDQATKAGPRRDDGSIAERRGPKGRGTEGTGPKATRQADISTSQSAVRDLLQSQGWEHLSVRASVLAEWGTLVGADLAQHVTVEDFTNGALKLRAESTAWATQVRLLAGEIQVVLDTRFGPGVVTSLEVQGPAAPRWGSGPRRVPGRGPRDTYG